MKSNKCVIETFPASRVFTIDVGRLGLLKHHIKALIELDVTDPLLKIRSKNSENEDKISFTSWMLKSIGLAVSEHKHVHALRKGRNKLVVFNDVDISLIVEKDADGISVPLPVIIRNVNGKSTNQIFNEIDYAKKTLSSEKDFVINNKSENKWVEISAMLPQFIRLFLWRIILSSPDRVKKMMGTAVVTSLGMKGSVSGWMIPYSIHPLCFAIGSIIKKPVAVNDRIEIRDILHMTILIDHDVVDGSPAARFVSRLKEIVESGHGL